MDPPGYDPPMASALKTIQDFLASNDVKSVIDGLKAFAIAPKPNKRKRHTVTSSSDMCPPRCPGVADIIAINDRGITAIRNTAHPVQRLVHTGFASPWDFGKHIRGIADTTGDGFGDIVGFGENGTYVALNNGDNTFGPIRNISDKFGYDGGWRVDKHIRWMADLRDSGRPDIIGLGHNDVYVALNNGDGTYGPVKSVLTEFCCGQGWTKDKHPRFLADMYGTGFLDIVGFASAEVFIARGNGDGTFRPAEAVCSDMTYNSGWRCDQHPRFLADMNGDGKLDLVGFANDGVYVAFNTGHGRFLPAQRVSSQFGFNSGLRMEETYRFVVDINGNGCADLLVIDKTGIFVAFNNGQGFFSSHTKRVSTDFCVDAGWLSTKHNPRMLVDMTGDGRPDIVGIGSNAIFVLYNDGNGNFSQKKQFIEGIGSSELEWASTLILAANLTPA